MYLDTSRIEKSLIHFSVKGHQVLVDGLNSFIGESK